MEKVKYEKILNILKKYDTESQIEEFTDSEEDVKFIKEIKKYFSSNKYNKQAVLGIDIYKYSAYTEEKQFLIPILFSYFMRQQ